MHFKHFASLCNYRIGNLACMQSETGIKAKAISLQELIEVEVLVRQLTQQSDTINPCPAHCDN